MRGPTASARTVLGLAPYVGDDPAAFLGRLGLGSLGPDDRVPARALVDAMAEAVRRTGDPSLGPRIATGGPLQRFDVMGYLFTSSPNLREGWANLRRTLGLWNAGFVMEVREHDDEVALVLRSVIPRVGPDTPGFQPLCELALTTGLVTARAATGRELVPRRARFIGVEPEDRSHLVRWFGTELAFRAPENALVFDRGVLDWPLTQADPGLSAILTRHADELLAKLPDDGGTVARQVRQQLARSLADAPDLAGIARRLGTSERTLQRRLREEGASFQDLVETVRRDLALRLLADPALATDDIAALTGFSEARAFHRAFRRWTGTTPGAVRATYGR